MDTAGDTYLWGGNSGEHGKTFERDLAFALFAGSCLANCRFKLAVERKDARKFDDVVMIKDNELWLFQAKHEQNSTGGSPITFNELFPSSRTSDSFSLPMYMQSFLDIENNDKFAGQKRYFIFTNRKLGDSRELKDLVTIESRSVESVMQFVSSSQCYIGFALKENSATEIEKLFNQEIDEIKNAIVKLFDMGIVLDVLYRYRTPLRSLLLDPKHNLYLRLHEDFLTSIDNRTEKFLFSELKQHYQKNDTEILSMEVKVNQSIKNLFQGRSRELRLPRIVEKRDVHDFLAHLVLCVEQPTDLQGVVDSIINTWMRQFNRPEDPDKYGKMQEMLIHKTFQDGFDEWYEREPSKSQMGKIKEYLMFEKEGTKCNEKIKSELERQLGKPLEAFSDRYTPRLLLRSNYATTISDNDFLKDLVNDSDNSQCYIVTGGPGIGKTTLLQYIDTQNMVNLDVFLIYLKKLQVENKTAYENDCLTIFEHALSQSRINILRTTFNDGKGKMLFMLDGFDNLHQSLHDSIISAVRKLLQRPFVRLIITGREKLQAILENKLVVNAMKLKPLNNDDPSSLSSFATESSQTRELIISNNLSKKHLRRLNKIDVFQQRIHEPIVNRKLQRLDKWQRKLEARHERGLLSSDKLRVRLERLSVKREKVEVANQYVLQKLENKRNYIRGLASIS